MLINPTIDTLVQRATAIAAILGDNEHQLTARQLVAFMTEYGNCAQAMRAVLHPDLKPASATYPVNEGTLWAWYCHASRLHESHDATTIVSASCAPKGNQQ